MGGGGGLRCEVGHDKRGRWVEGERWKIGLDGGIEMGDGALCREGEAGEG